MNATSAANEILEMVVFGGDSSELTAEGRSLLRAAVDYACEHPDDKVIREAEELAGIVRACGTFGGRDWDMYGDGYRTEMRDRARELERSFGQEGVTTRYAMEIVEETLGATRRAAAWF